MATTSASSRRRQTSSAAERLPRASRHRRAPGPAPRLRASHRRRATPPSAPVDRHASHHRHARRRRARAVPWDGGRATPAAGRRGAAPAALAMLVPAAVVAVVVWWTTPGRPTQVHADADLDDRWRRNRDVNPRLHDRGANDGPRAPPGTAGDDLAVKRRRRHANVNDRSRVNNGRVNIVDHHKPWPLAVIDRIVRPHVPVGAAAELELRLRRGRVPVVVRPAQIAVGRRSEVHVHVGDRVGAVERIPRALVVERGRIADEVVLAVRLPVKPRIRGLVVVNVRDGQVTEAAPDLLR